MAAEIHKYKHYLLILGALVLANYILIPLSEWQEELKQNLVLLKKQDSKVNDLINEKGDLQKALDVSNIAIKEFNGALFNFPSEGEFKIAAQAKIEKALASTKCSIERIGFKGSNEVTKNIKRWTIDIRYKGDLGCMTKATRVLEELTPYVDIVSYSMNHSGLTDELKGNLTGRMEVGVWYKETVK